MGGEGPTGNLNSIDKYYTDKGFTPNPPLELKEKNQVASYEKPLPEGRVHVKVFRTPKNYVSDLHTDSADPNRNPFRTSRRFRFSRKAHCEENQKARRQQLRYINGISGLVAY